MHAIEKCTLGAVQQYGHLVTGSIKEVSRIQLFRLHITIIRSQRWEKNMFRTYEIKYCMKNKI